MISCHTITSSAGAASYHDNAFNAESSINKADNYYLGELADAKWQGKGAALLGMEGKKIDRQEFIDLLDGKIKNPVTGEIQDLKEGGNSNRRLGFDLTVSAPKSVSIVALVGKDERLVKAHIEASHKAMDWLQEHGALIRVKDDQGVNRMERTGNLIWASVVHETSRLNEPQLHSHNVLMAVTWDEQREKWRSLTNDEIINLRNNADDIYKGALLKLVQEAGYGVRYSENGRDFEIVGVSKELIEAFSGRSKQIDDLIRAEGIDPNEATWEKRQTVALKSRDAKENVPSEVVHAAWEAVMQAKGLSLDQPMDEAKERAATGSPVMARLENMRLASLAVSTAIEHLSERQQVFKAAELEHAAAFFGKADIDDVRTAIRDHIEGHQLIVGSHQGQMGAVYTTQKGLDAERQTLATIQEGRGQGVGVVTSEAEFQVLLKQFEGKKTQELGKPFELSKEQVLAARNILMHQDQFQGIQGDAGTGKTAALEFVRSVADEKGWSIQGVAVTSSAAKELEQSTGIPSKTVAGFFANRANAMNSLRLEITQLEQWIHGKLPLEQSAAPRIEIKDLQAKSFDLNYGQNVYIFDHQRGNVFKAGSGLIDRFAVNVLQKVDAYRSTAEPDTWRTKVADIGERIAVSALTARQVGVVEGHAARQALYQGNREETLRKLATVLDEKQGALAKLEGAGGAAQSKTIYVMDESSMTGALDMHRFVEFAGHHAARVVLQGDIKQHGSVAAGRSFEQMQTAGLHLSTLKETRRFDNATQAQKDAVVSVTNQAFVQAIEKLPRLDVQPHQVHTLTADRYLENMRQLQAGGKQTPVVAVVTVTNADRKMANAEIHSLLHLSGLLGSDAQTKEHFDRSLLTKAEMRNIPSLAKDKVDRLVFQQNYSEIGVKQGDVLVINRLDQGARRIMGTIERNGMSLTINPDKQSNYSVFKAEERSFAVGDKVEARAAIRGERGENLSVSNGSRGLVAGVTKEGLEIKWTDGTSDFLKNDHARFIDHGYAHTTIKDQGATYDRVIITASEKASNVFNEQSTLVAITRARDNTEIITSNYEGMLKIVGKEVDKSLAADVRPLEKTADIKIDVGAKDKGQDLGKVVQKDQRELSV